MNQIKIGLFLKELRNQKGITQEELAQVLNVSNRSISRWENGNTMPDFDLLIELARYYDISIDEIIDAKRKDDETMDKQTEKTLYKVAEYTNQEKEKIANKIRFFATISVLCWLVFITLSLLGLDEQGIGEIIANFAAGAGFGITLSIVIYSSRYSAKIQRFKKRLFNIE